MRMNWVVVVALSACMPADGEATLDVSARSLTATRWRVQVTGTNSKGTVATGSVSITSEAGSLMTPAQVEFDSFGTAIVEVTCDASSEPACAQPFRVRATWLVNMKRIEGSTLIDSIGGSSGGGGGATGGGSGIGGGSFASTAVLMLGTLQEGACGRDAIADPRNPTRVEVGFPCGIDHRWARWVGGSLYYITSNTSLPGVRRFRPDAWDRMGGMSVYPSPDKSPDDVLFGDCGSPRFWFSPSGQILHTCDPRNPNVYFIDGVETTIPMGNATLAFGENNTILMRDGVSTNGTLNAYSPPLFLLPEAGAYLPVSGGFIATIGTTTGCELHMISPNGSHSVIGSYPVTCLAYSTLTEDGTMTGTTNGGDSVLEVPLNGTPTTIYSESNATPDDYTVFPPRVFLKFHISDLVGRN